jgi:hypothetical protein
MGDGRDESDRGERGHRDGPDQRERGGPQGSEFLDLEISQVLLSEANRLARGAALDIVREAMRERLQERLGAKLEAVGRLAADELADDVEANLEIEARFVRRREQRESLEERLRAIFSAAAAPTLEGRRRKRTGSRRRG